MMLAFAAKKRLGAVAGSNICRRHPAAMNSGYHCPVFMA